MELRLRRPFRRCTVLGSVVLFLAGIHPARADQKVDARAVADSYLKLLDQDDTEAAYKKVGEQWKLTTSKGEWMAEMHRWLDAKGGGATSRSVVLQQTLSPDEARKISPTATLKGNVYAFRYRSKYPKGVFFEDLYINIDSDGILRVGGHHPQPAE